MRDDSGAPLDGGTRDGGRAVSDASDSGEQPDDTGIDGGCMPTSAPDEPDPMMLDENCDGIDGDVEDAIFVASTGTADAAGTMDAPVSTISRGMELASEAGRSMVLVASGEYTEALVLRSGVSIFGGYDSSTWERSDVRATVRAQGPVLRATDIAERTTVSAIDFEASDADEPGESSLAAMLVRSSALVLERVALRAGTAAAGISPTRPDPRPMSAMGTTGGAAVRSGTCSGGGSTTEPAQGGGGSRTIGCGCGHGGTGGRAGQFYRGSGFTTPSAGGNGFLVTDCGLFFGSGVMGGAASSGGSDGRRGNDGTPGTAGASGLGGGSAPVFAESGYGAASGTQGTDGTPGEGGGGGGGGGGCSLDFDGFCQGSGGAGGGGGAGGCGGVAGLGGGGGGASIGLYLWQSSPVLIRVDIRAGNGGNGGSGSRGGAGGPGGMGGRGGARYTAIPCALGTSTVGGAGGNGGAGGEGGGGGGGSGGPSIGIVLGGGSMQAPGSMGVSIATGSGGMRGLGGGTAPAGENGFVQPTLTVGG